MKQIVCEFSDHDLAEQAAHSLRQQGYSILEESFEAKEYPAKTPPVAMAGQLMGFPSQPVPDGFVILHSENQTEPARWVARSVFLVQMSRPAGFAVGC